VAANVHLPDSSRWFWPLAIACNAGAVAGAIAMAHL
jgi:hypothetical protein